MKSELTTVLTNAVIGVALGAGSKLAENSDTKRAQTWEALPANATKKYPFFKRIDNYVSFGVPVLALMATFVPQMKKYEQYTDKALLAGSVLAGLKIVGMMTSKNYKQVYMASPVARGGSMVRLSSSPSQWRPANHPAQYANPVDVNANMMAGVVTDNRGM
jgi:hypothetical protein